MGKKYIDADKAIADYAHYGISHCYDAYDLEDILTECPAADVVEVVRCKDCKWYDYGELFPDIKWCKKGNNELNVDEMDYCSYGEQR